MFKHHHKKQTNNQQTQTTNNSSQSLFSNELNSIKQNNPYYSSENDTSYTNEEYIPENTEICHTNRHNKSVRQENNNNQVPHKKNIFVRVLIIIILVIIFILGGLILNLTIKRTHAINESKEQDAAQIAKYTENSSQKKVREEFDKKYNSIITGNNNTDIQQNVTMKDAKYLENKIDELSPSYKHDYQKKLNNIKPKIEIQVKFNKFFVNNTINSKAVKDSVTPNQIFKFNNKYDSVINKIYQNNNNDAFAKRMNSDQLRLTNDASAILDIYTETSSLYTQLGDKENNWTFKLNNNVVPDKGQLSDQNLDVLNKENNNGSKIKLQLISDIQTKIQNLAFNWGNRLDLVKQLLNMSHNPAIDNYNNIVDAINAALAKQNKDNNAKNDNSKKQNNNSMPNTFTTPDININQSPSNSNSNNNSDSSQSNNNQNNGDNANNSSQNNDSDDNNNSNDNNNNDNNSGNNNQDNTQNDQTNPDEGPDATNEANHF